jgi:hypothetical protein
MCTGWHRCWAHAARAPRPSQNTPPLLSRIGGRLGSAAPVPIAVSRHGQQAWAAPRTTPAVTRSTAQVAVTAGQSGRRKLQQPSPTRAVHNLRSCSRDRPRPVGRHAAPTPQDVSGTPSPGSGVCRRERHRHGRRQQRPAAVQRRRQVRDRVGARRAEHEAVHVGTGRRQRYRMFHLHPTRLRAPMTSWRAERRISRAGF